MAYDLLVKNAQICDGTGAPIYLGSLAVDKGKIAALGNVAGIAHRELDAHGSVLAPGFIDIHTHYDAQVSWDPLLTCSSWHGITSVLMGNCGVGVAPVRPQARRLLRGGFEGQRRSDCGGSVQRDGERSPQARCVVYIRRG